jgi:hypothetical protein
MSCTLNTTDPVVGDDLVVLLKKIVQALGEEWHCHDGEWQLVATILRHYGGTPSPGDSLMLLWQKIRIALGDVDCHCGDSEWQAMRRALDQLIADMFRVGDSKYNLAWAFLEALTGTPPVVLDPPVITQTGLNELTVSGLYFGSGGVTLIVESSVDGVVWTVFSSTAVTGDPAIVDITGETDSFFRARVDVNGTFTPYSSIIEVYRPPATFANFPNDDVEDYTDGVDLDGLNGGDNGNNNFTIIWASDYEVGPYGADGGSGGVVSPDGVLNLEQWIDADEIVGLNDGDPVSTWTDLTGNGRDFTAAGGDRPTYNTNVQGGHLTSTGGVGMDSSYGFAAGDFTILVAYRSNATNLGGRRLIQGQVNNWLIGPYGDQPRVFSGAFVQVFYPTLTPMVIAWRHNGGSGIAEAYVNGILAARRSAAVGYPGDIALGARGAFNEPASCRLFAYAAYSRYLTPDEIWGISKGWINKYSF